MIDAAVVKICVYRSYLWGTGRCRCGGGVEELERADGGEVASLWVIGWALCGYILERDFLYFMISYLTGESLNDHMRKIIGG